MSGRSDGVRRFAAAYASVPRDRRPMQLQTLASAGQYRHAYALARVHLAGAGNVLDWGCGNGHFARFLLEAGHRVTGYSYDPPPEFVADHAGFSFVPGVPDDPRRLPFADASFDAACSIGVLEHVHELGGDQPDSLRELWRVLRPGGILLIVHFPNAGSWIEAVVRVANRLGVTDKHQHSRMFRRADLDRLFGSGAWRVLAQARYNLIPRNALRRLPPAIGDAPVLCGALNAVDDALGALLPALAQNWYAVLQKAHSAP